MSKTIVEQLKDIFTTVKVKLAAIDAPPTPLVEPEKVEPAKLAATDYTLADGTILSIDNLAVGGAVMNGETVAADGSYTLPSGDEITVVGGMITVLTPAAKEAVEAPETEMKKDMVAMQSHIKTLEVKLSKVESIEARFTAQSQQIESLKEVNKELFAAVELMSNQSIQTPLEKEKSFEDLTAFEKWKVQQNKN